MKNKHIFDFSIVMAVYNVELYLRDAIESVIKQDFGFERIQLILVDDGSPDNSGAICDEYGKMYSANVVVIHKANGGVSSARNEGLKAARGTYINFLDSDDRFDPNVCSEVYRFFQKHDDVDVVSIPLSLFEGRTGEHVLNYKFSKGSRVIDLHEEYDAIQLACNSAFCRKSVVDALEQRFIVGQKYAEDATFMQPILWQKMKLGVVHSCRYQYRVRQSGPKSALQTSLQNNAWWLKSLRMYQHFIIERAVEQLNEVPRFVQYAMMYDLQWKIQQKSFPEGLLTDDEKKEFLDELKWIYSFIENKIILEQRNMSIQQKLHVLREKNAGNDQLISKKDDVVFSFEGNVEIGLSDCPVVLEFLTMDQEQCTIEGYTLLPIFEKQEQEVLVKANGVQQHVELFDRNVALYSLEKKMAAAKGFKATIPLKKHENTRISFESSFDGQRVVHKGCRVAQYFPIGIAHKDAYYAHAGWIAQIEEGQILIKPSNIVSHIKHELAFLHDLWTENILGGRKAIPVRVLSHVLKCFKRKRIWLLSDRVNKADDNGEAFFRYLSEKMPEGIRAYYVIAKECSDYKKMVSVGNTVKHYSWKHKVLHLLCDYNISSSGDQQTINPFMGHQEGYRDLLCDSRFIFLQHGVTMNDMSGWLNRHNKAIYGFVTSAEPEYRSILEGNYDYTPNEVWLTGMPRHDRLFHQESRYIALMPTWRKTLASGMNEKTGIWELSDDFEESDYFQFYNAFINHPRLLEALARFDYRFLFMPHPIIMPYIDKFKKNDRIEFASISTPYSEVFAKSNLAISDYSSAVFDFAYLRKPIVYTQFDAEAFYSGRHVCEKGYFDYERDGFGEITRSVEETVDTVISYMRDGCQLKPRYRERIDQFFAFNDHNNCQRLYEKILEMER